jgi:hypothetical protein
MGAGKGSQIASWEEPSERRAWPFRACAFPQIPGRGLNKFGEDVARDLCSTMTPLYTKTFRNKSNDIDGSHKRHDATLKDLFLALPSGRVKTSFARFQSRQPAELP